MGRELTDEEYIAAERRHLDHMERFAAAHIKAPMGALLIELERRDHWALCVGDGVASVVESPFVRRASDYRGADAD